MEIDTDVECTLPELWQPVLDALALREFGTDPCTNVHATVPARRRIMLPEDGLSAVWDGVVWCNHPYSRPRPWIERCADHFTTAVCLSKGDYSTKVWPEVIWARADLVVLLNKRQRFYQPAQPDRRTTAKWTNALSFFKLPKTFDPAPLAALGKLVWR